MAWVKLDDSMPTHPKVMASGVDGYALDVAGISYCNRYSTDGFIAFHVIGAVLPMLRNPQKVAAKLVEVGRWSQVEGGWLIHDYHDYQPTAEHQREVSAKRAEAGRLGGSKPKPKQNAYSEEPERKQNASTVSNPVPSRPVPDPSKEDLAPKPARARNPVWDALVDVFGEPTTTTARSLRGKLTASLTAAGAQPDEIVTRARSWPLHFPDATLTETALEKHWDRLGRVPLKLAAGQVDQLEDEQRRLARRARADELDRKALPR